MYFIFKSGFRAQWFRAKLKKKSTHSVSFIFMIFLQVSSAERVRFSASWWFWDGLRAIPAVCFRNRQHQGHYSVRKVFTLLYSMKQPGKNYNKLVEKTRYCFKCFNRVMAFAEWYWRITPQCTKTDGKRQ